MRPLKNREIEIIKTLLSSNPKILDRFITEVKTYRVEEMNDGGMGSLRFCSDDKSRRWGTTIAELELKDLDEIPVLIALNLDTNGNFFELDVWKVDYSPVIELQDG